MSAIFIIGDIFFLGKATYISLKVTVGFYDPIKKKNGRADGQIKALRAGIPT